MRHFIARTIQKYRLLRRARARVTDTRLYTVQQQLNSYWTRLSTVSVCLHAVPRHSFARRGKKKLQKNSVDFGRVQQQNATALVIEGTRMGNLLLFVEIQHVCTICINNYASARITRSQVYVRRRRLLTRGVWEHHYGIMVIERIYNSGYTSKHPWS